MKILILYCRPLSCLAFSSCASERGRDHDHHDSRDYHCSAAGGDAADNDYSHHRLLIANHRSQGERACNARALFS